MAKKTSIFLSRLYSAKDDLLFHTHKRPKSITCKKTRDGIDDCGVGTEEDCDDCTEEDCDDCTEEDCDNCTEEFCNNCTEEN